MNILPRLFVTLNVLLFAKQATQNILQETSLEDNDWKQLNKWMSDNDTNSTILFDANGTPRDKRALGILLQGLVQALGYNSTPIQLATLPNPNTTGTTSAGPINFDIRNANPPPPSPSPPGMPAVAPLPAASAPKQRETLRFTGVVNFGNNSDILGHLRQYEQIFHSSTSAKPPTPQPSNSVAKPPSAPKPQRLNALLEPYFIPIPIPLSPNIQNVDNLQYPQKPLFSILPSAPVKTPVNHKNLSTVVEHEYVNKEHKETHDVRSEEIIGEKIPNFDERQNAHEKRIQSNKRRPAQSSNTSNEDADRSGEHDQGRRPNYNENESNETSSELQTERGSEEEVDNSSERDGKIKVDNAKKEYSDEKQEESSEEKGELNKEDIKEEDASETDKQSDEHEEETFESPSQKSSLKTIPNEEEERKKILLEDAEEYAPKRIPNLYLVNLPIEEKPLRGPFMDSYGQSLEHEGRIDENVADYFQNYKNSPFGVFDASSINPEIRRRPWWIDGTSRNLIGKLQTEYAPLTQKRYEEYELNDSENKKSEQRRQIVKQEPGKKTKKAKEKNENPVVSSPTNKEKRRKVQKGKSTDTHRKDKLTESLEINERSIGKAPYELPALKTFDFIKYSPYYTPVQYFFSPESLEQSAQRILARHNPEEYENTDEQTVSVEVNQKSSEEKASMTSPSIRLKSAIEKIEKSNDHRLQQDEDKKIKAWLVPLYVTTVGATESIKPMQKTNLRISKENERINEDPTSSYETPVTYYPRREKLSEQLHSGNQSRLTSGETASADYYDSDSSVKKYDHHPEPTNETPVRYQTLEIYPHQHQDDMLNRQYHNSNRSQSSEESSVSEYNSPEESSEKKYIENAEYIDSANSSMLQYHPQFSKRPSTNYEQIDDIPYEEYTNNASGPTNEPLPKKYENLKLNDTPQYRFTVDSAQIQSTPFFKQYQAYVNLHRELTDEITPRQPYRFDNSTEKEYIGDNTERTENLPIYNNSEDYSEQQFVNHHPQSADESFSVKYSNTYPEESPSNTYQIKQIKVPITTYNPTTYKLQAPTPHYDTQNTTHRNQHLRYQYSQDHDDDVNKPATEDQPKYYISYPKTFTIHPHNGEPNTPINDYIFGQRIDQSRQEIQIEASDVNKHNDNNNLNSKTFIASTKRIVNLPIDKKNRRKFFGIGGESMTNKADSTSTVEYKNVEAPIKIPSQRSFIRRAQVKNYEMERKRHIEMENRVTDILDNLKHRLLID